MRKQVFTSYNYIIIVLYIYEVKYTGMNVVNKSLHIAFTYHYIIFMNDYNMACYTSYYRLNCSSFRVCAHLQYTLRLVLIIAGI